MALLLLLPALLGTAAASPAVDQLLKSELEAAAAESRHLADELSGMLARLERGEGSQAGGAAVAGEQQEVEAALQEMVEKIEQLAEASEDSSADTVSGLVKKKRVKEQELRKTLEQLEVVAGQIEAAADSAGSSEEGDSIQNIANLLQSISDKVETDNDVDDEEVFRRQFAKAQSPTGLELNGIAEMIKTLEKVTKDLREDTEDTEEPAEDKAEDKAEDTAEDKAEDKAEDTADKAAEEEGLGGEAGVQRPRGGKSLDDAAPGSLASTAGRLLDVLGLGEAGEVEEADKGGAAPEEADRSGMAPEEAEEKVRGGKADEVVFTPPEEGPECSGKSAEDRVRVCLPEVAARRGHVTLPSARLHEEQVCLDVSRAVCNETSAVLSREVCTYEYRQAEVLAPVQAAELTFQPRVEKLGVTRCHLATEPQGYRQVQVERCVMDYIDSPYILPDLAINVDDFLQLQLPEPEKRCTVFQYELPEVVCGQDARHHCVNLAHLEPYQVMEQVGEARLGYGGSCAGRTLTQEQQICTVTKNVKQPKYGGYRAY